MSLTLLEEFVKQVISEDADAAACKYEKVVISSLRKSGLVGRIRRAACADSHRADADIRIGDEFHYLEIKKDSHAQMGGGSVGYSSVDKRFYPTGKNIDFSDSMADTLNEQHDTSLIHGLDGLLSFLSRVNKREFTQIPISGFSQESWQRAEQKRLIQMINRTFTSDMSVITEHYLKKDTHYIQIGGAGLFRLGESNPANLPIPALQGRVQLELRVGKSGKSKSSQTAGIRVQARLLISSTSSFNLDDPESCNKLLQSIRPNRRNTKSQAPRISASLR